MLSSISAKKTHHLLCNVEDFLLTFVLVCCSIECHDMTDRVSDQVALALCRETGSKRGVLRVSNKGRCRHPCVLIGLLNHAVISSRHSRLGTFHRSIMMLWSADRMIQAALFIQTSLELFINQIKIIRHECGIPNVRCNDCGTGFSGHRQGSVHVGCPAAVHPHRFTSHESRGSSIVLHITRGQCTMYSTGRATRRRVWLATRD